MAMCKSSAIETDYLVVADIMCLGPFEGACFLRGLSLIHISEPTRPY